MKVIVFLTDTWMHQQSSQVDTFVLKPTPKRKVWQADKMLEYVHTGFKRMPRIWALLGTASRVLLAQGLLPPAYLAGLLAQLAVPSIAVNTLTLSNKAHLLGGFVTLFRSQVLDSLLFNVSAHVISAAKRYHEPGRLLARYNSVLNR